MRNENSRYLDNERFENSIASNGWHVIMVKSTAYQPSFAYTIGLWQNFNHPEVICLGLPAETMHLILNDIGELIKQGETIQLNKPYQDFLEDYLTTFISVDPSNIKDYFGAALAHYQDLTMPALQFVWPDKNHRFPWAENFEPSFKRLQPLLDRNADFKFMEDKNLAVFTTRQWLEEGAPIVEVYHDEEGDWQFITEDWEEEDIRTVALEEIVKRDASINDLFNLDYGESAYREDLTSSWHRTA
ncbi:DUF4262 domain-containing protein [Olivibacter sp. XZL3]|uniref:DUF4262 domain-containing protein n=1 Tax=Olivibacter sp. XZL3 TaxID=1735116 RepID=UPI001064A050|nr:DUF4262 domain-containing protein [Olivibacter sp. XZL3]